jgi:beta-galactosidase/beta-glucuronidase
MMTLAREEYPRPHFDRSHSWQTLNGSWDFAADPAGLRTPDDVSWPNTITVPFAWETAASGIASHWLSCGWYRREIEVPAGWQRVVLHFGAVHHAATVWVNGIDVGTHVGGYTPFEIDVTDALTGRLAVIVVRVDAPVDKRDIVHGKQRSVPRDDYDGCAFTPSSGIWQSVWLESRPATYIAHVALSSSPSLDAIVATVAVAGPRAGDALLRISIDGAPPLDVKAGVTQLPIDAPRLWQPEDPHLYPIEVTLESGDGIDRVGASTGLRSIATEAGQIMLNGERLYVRGVLDQGYWPETGITAPTDHAFVVDLELARKAGFNLVRKHLKLEDPRFLFHADRLGMLVWAEPASTGIFTPNAMELFEAQIDAMVARDGNHPCIVIWALYNEEWGLDWDVPNDPAKQDAVRRAFRRLKALDASRPAIDNSGWTHVETDIVDWHVYDETPSGWAGKLKALMSGQIDRFPVSIAVGTIVDKLLMATGGPAPLDLPNINGEYGGGYTSVERGWNIHWQTQEMRRYDRLSGYIYTELYDIENETAGIYTFDRGEKDLGANNPALVNAVTVPILDIDPTAAGRDLVAATRDINISVTVSHHGTAPLMASIVAVWGQSMRTLDLATVDLTPSEYVMDVKPFRLGDALNIRTVMPAHLESGRLHVLLVAEGSVAGAAYLDVALEAAQVHADGRTQ